MDIRGTEKEMSGGVRVFVLLANAKDTLNGQSVEEDGRTKDVPVGNVSEKTRQRHLLRCGSLLKTDVYKRQVHCCQH